MYTFKDCTVYFYFVSLTVLGLMSKCVISVYRLKKKKNTKKIKISNEAVCQYEV